MITLKKSSMKYKDPQDGSMKDVGAIIGGEKVPTKLSELENDKNFVDNTVSNLMNYYLKNETLSKDEIKQLIGAIPKFSIEVVDELPTTNISNTTVYLLTSGDEVNNLYTEYIYVNGKWEYLGKQNIDLTGYALVSDIPTKLSQLEEDSTHRTVTDDEKQKWNNKSDFSGNYNDLENKPTIPTKTSELANDSDFIGENVVTNHNTSETSHNDIRLLIEGLSARLNALADSDDTTLDQMSEVVAYIKSNKELIDGITTSKVNVADIIDNLETSASNRPLSAKQGVLLKALIDDIETNKVNKSDVNTHVTNKSNPHGVTAEQVGAYTKEQADNTFAEKNHTHDLATQSKNGFLSKEDKKKIDRMIPVSNNAAAHNAIFRGKDLTNVYTIDEICERITYGTFEDLYIGDYFRITFTNPNGVEESMWCVFAAFDYYHRETLSQYDSPIIQHNALIVPKNCLYEAYAMNLRENYTTYACEGGFIGTTVFQTTLPAYAESLKEVFGEHLRSHKNMFTNGINAEGASAAGAGMIGYASGWSERSVYLSLLSEVQVLGTQIWSSSPLNVGMDSGQLPLFALDKSAKLAYLEGIYVDGYVDWWLRDVASAHSFCMFGANGRAVSKGATSVLGLRPIFLIGNPDLEM